MEYNTVMRCVKSDDTGSLDGTKAGRAVFFAECDRFVWIYLYLYEKVMTVDYSPKAHMLAADVVSIEGSPRE